MSGAKRQWQNQNGVSTASLSSLGLLARWHAASCEASTYVPAAIAGQDWVACATGTATATLTSGQRMVDAIACRQHTCVLGTTCVMCAPPYGRRNNRTSSAGSAYRSRPPVNPAFPANPQVKQLRWRRPYVSFYIRCGVNKQTVFVYGYSSLSLSPAPTPAPPPPFLCVL